MCGFIVSSLTIPQTAYEKIQNRGPDSTNNATIGNIHFTHFLLHLTGEIVTQPFQKNNIVCIFNGEIYNYKEIHAEARSDVESIIVAYQNYGDEFVQKLDGEFTFVLIDFEKRYMYVASDVFKTKPLFYAINENIVIASYESSCKTILDQHYTAMEPNTMLKYHLDTRELISKTTVHHFDLSQTKDSYVDFNAAFEKAVLKRIPQYCKPLVTLSSGLDSGSISCCLHKHNIPALHVTIPRNEDQNVIHARKNKLGNDSYIMDITPNEKTNWKLHLIENCEPFQWDWRYHPKLKSSDSGFNKSSMQAKCKILTYAREQNIRVLFSGIGADEIMAHNQYYSNGYGNVDTFPDDLHTVFPWFNFFKGSMENYMKGEEYVGGCFGFETRYPFLDTDFVQEFLWLKPELKNTYKGTIYKPGLMQYLYEHNFPTCNRKLGFNV